MLKSSDIWFSGKSLRSGLGAVWAASLRMFDGLLWDINDRAVC
ncbi:hypothetical protein Z948_2133 [Sulfitobacter donghicola DSW-25 = KCTC 12864 = JCM 14565]|nr:hypothetical protein Z948_2133 [Sulfitobacter donghicola DSW-25 = KCTC 12864 = JCM 14565]